MPGAHRHGDARKCGASNIVNGQSTVTVNGQLWSVDGDPNSHGAGHNKPITGSTVSIEGKLVIVALGDTCYDPDGLLHVPGVDDPLQSSSDVSAYG